MTEISVTTDGPVCTIMLDRPDALNAITPTMLAELNEAASEVAQLVDVRVVVLTGRGRAFSAGVDLKSLGERELVDGKVGDILDVPARQLTETIATMPKPVVAAVNGFCFTGALEVALSADIMIVANEAKIGDTHAKWGLRPTWGMTQRLVDAVGLARARELSYTARSVGGEEAVAIGLAARNAPLASFATSVDSLVEELLANSSESFAAYKDLYQEHLRSSEGLAREYGREYPFSDTDERLAGFR